MESKTKLIPLTPAEIAEQMSVARRRLPLQRFPGALNLNYILSLNEETGMSYRQEKRRERRLNYEKNRLPNGETKVPDSITEKEMFEFVINAFSNEIKINELRDYLKRNSISIRTYYEHVRDTKNAEKLVEKGPSNDRKMGSQGKIIKWEIDDENQTFYFQKGYQGFSRSKNFDIWRYCDGPTFPNSHLDFLKYKINEFLVDTGLNYQIIRIDCHKKPNGLNDI